MRSIVCIYCLSCQVKHKDCSNPVEEYSVKLHENSKNILCVCSTHGSCARSAHMCPAVSLEINISIISNRHSSYTILLISCCTVIPVFGYHGCYAWNASCAYQVNTNEYIALGTTLCHSPLLQGYLGFISPLYRVFKEKSTPIVSL